MKRLLFCITAIIMMLSSMLPSYAATTYIPDANGGQVLSDSAVGKKAVLIQKGSAEPSVDNIVYVAQAETGFTAATNFLIKKTADDGLYTIILSGNGEVVKNTFYIGMTKTGEMPMTKHIDNSTPENSVRYICKVNPGEGAGYNFQSVIIKMGDKHYGFSLPDNGWSVSGSEMTYGVQINAESKEQADKISDVWLSEGSISSTTGELIYGEAEN